MKHIAQDDLIAYQLRELSDVKTVQAHLEQCAQCAALSESIAETLRVFSADPVPQVNVDHAWQRMRGGLPLVRVSGHPARWWQRPLWAVPLLMAMLCIVYIALRPHSSSTLPSYANNRPGPLTQQPTDAAENVAVTTHLDSAERLLTTVNHADGPLDADTRMQARTLLVTNAMYVQQATATGHLAEVSLLEQLGRVLTTLEHQPLQGKQDKGWHIRFEINTDGLLLDLRILKQNNQRNGLSPKDPQ